MIDFVIENGEKLRCPNCQDIIGIRNESELLFRGISILYTKKLSNVFSIKCRKCGHKLEVK